MECIIPGPNVKVIARALQALAKVGDELFIEARNDSFSLVTLNSSKTVCARFKFSDTFFSSYDVSQDEATVGCKIHMKVFLPLFKGNVEKKLDYAKLEYTSDSDFVIFKMKYKCDDIVMIHNLHLMNPETLSIGVVTDSSSNSIGATSSFYSQFLSMFDITDDEITFEINEGKIVARNYCLGTPCRPKKMRTQINLNSNEFLSYTITKLTSINFSLKPLRTVVHFGEHFNLDIEFKFEVGGKPLSMILKDPTFEVNFMVATLDPYSDSNTSVATTAPHPNDVTNEELAEMEDWEKDFSPPKENVDVLPESPEHQQSKKAKTVFGRCYDTTFHATVLGEVLAANSDSE